MRAVSTTSPRDPVTMAAHQVGSPRSWGAARLSCLVKGFYGWDGTLHLDKRAGMRTAWAEYPALQSERAPTVTGITPSNRSRGQSTRPQEQSESSHKDPVIIDRSGRIHPCL